MLLSHCSLRVAERSFRPLLTELAKASATYSFVPELNQGKILCKEGIASQFTIVARDALNRPRIGGGDLFVARFATPLVGHAVVAAVELDGKIGHYVVPFTVPTAGEFRVSVALNGLDIKDSPFRVESVPTQTPRDLHEGPGRVVRECKRYCTLFSLVSDVFCSAGLVTIPKEIFAKIVGRR